MMESYEYGDIVEFKTRASSKTVHKGVIIRFNMGKKTVDVQMNDGSIIEGVKTHNIRVPSGGASGDIEDNSSTDDDEFFMNQRPFEPIKQNQSPGVTMRALRERKRQLTGKDTHG